MTKEKEIEYMQFKGKYLKDMSRKELMEAVYILGKLYAKQLKNDNLMFEKRA